jgi:hypothetical protein
LTFIPTFNNFVEKISKSKTVYSIWQVSIGSMTDPPGCWEKQRTLVFSDYPKTLLLTPSALAEGQQRQIINEGFSMPSMDTITVSLEGFPLFQ